jgi:ankyrin repeat protein
MTGFESDERAVDKQTSENTFAVCQLPMLGVKADVRCRAILILAVAIAAGALPAQADEIHQLLADGRIEQAKALLIREPRLINAIDPDTEEWPLHVATRCGQLEMVRFLLEHGAQVNARQHNDGVTPLHLAYEPEIVKLLLEHGADAKARDASGKLPLRYVLNYRRPDLRIVKLLVDGGSPYDIFAAITLGDIGRVRMLLKNDAKLAKERDERWVFPLGLAVLGGRADIVELLLKNGANPNAVDSAAYSVLLLAIPHPPVVEVLLRAGADVRFRWTCKNISGGWRGSMPPEGSTALHFAADKGQLETARLLLKYGASVAALAGLNWTPLHSAASEGWPLLVKLLLEKGADAKARTSEGKTPMELAAAQVQLLDRMAAQEENRRYLEAMQILRAAGSPVDFFSALAFNDVKQVAALLKEKPELANSEDHSNAVRTALGRAVELNEKDMVLLLLAHGARANGRSTYGHTALHEAAFWGREEMARLLIARGAEANAKAQDGDTPLHTAVSMGQFGVAKVLLESGAKPDARENDGHVPLDWVEYGMDIYRGNTGRAPHSAKEWNELFRRYAPGK